MPQKQNNVPALRFPEFDGGWEEKKLGEMGDFKNGINKNKEDFGYGVPFFNLLDVFGRASSDKLPEGLVNANKKEIDQYSLKKGDVLFIRSSVKRSGVGETCLINHDFPLAIYSGFLIRYRCDSSKIDNNFKKHCFWNFQFRKRLIAKSSTSANTNINQESLSSLKLLLPTLPEQQKIADFLSSVDEKISCLEKEKSLLEHYKKGIMQKIFKQEIRFKDDNGHNFPDWELSPLSKYLFETKTRNYDALYTKEDVLSVSGDHGIVNQILFQGRSFAGASVLNYHIVETHNVVYTKSPLKKNPYGIIKANFGNNGIVSTLYAVYGCKSNICPYFINYYFSLDDNVNKYLRPLVKKGSKNDMKINNYDVLKGIVCFPQSQEQKKIAEFLSEIDAKIAFTSKELTLAQNFKKGLLQKMFI